MLSDDGQLSTTIFFLKCLLSSISCNIQGVYIWQDSGFFFCTFPELKLWTNTNNKSCLPEPLQYPSCQRNVHSTLLCKNSLQTWIKATCLTRVHHEFHWKALFFTLLHKIYCLKLSKPLKGLKKCRNSNCNLQIRWKISSFMFTITDHKPFILYTIFNKYQLGFGPEREKIFFLQPNLVFFLGINYLLSFSYSLIYVLSIWIIICIYHY